MSDESVSEEQPEDQSKNSVYDFFYHDPRRVASFLAQFEVYGPPTQIKSSEYASRTGTTRVSGGAEGGVPGFAKGRAGSEWTDISEERDTGEWTYDPLWRNAITLLNYLSDRDLIERDITQARVGQFVVISGNLAVGDLELLRKAWDNQTIRRRIGVDKLIKDARSEHRKNKGIGNNQSEVPELEYSFELLKILPHSLQGTIISGPTNGWFTLDRDSLSIGPNDLFLKHGLEIPGEWSLLGILDALPQTSEELDAASERRLSEDGMSSILGGVAAMFLQNIVTPSRLLLGRPIFSYGITPLLIFRELSKANITQSPSAK